MENYKSQYLEKYAEFLNQLYEMSSLLHNQIDENKNLSDEEKINNGIKFHSVINSSKDNKTLFLNRKIKLFSSKSNVSTVLFKNISLKKVLNNQSNKVKKNMWDFIQLLYVFIDIIVTDEPDITYNKKLIEQIQSEYKEIPKVNAYPEILSKLDVNEKTNELIKDVIKTFNEDNIDFKNGDPVNILMNIANEVQSKYGESLDNGEIDVKNLIEQLSKVNPILENLTKTLNLDQLTKEEQKVVIDENFSTDQITVKNTKQDETPNLMEIMKIMDQFKNPDENNPIGKMIIEMAKLTGDDNNDEDFNVEEQQEKILNMMQQNFGIDPSQMKEMYENINNQSE